MSVASSTTTEIDLMLASHRARLFVLQFELIIATQPGMLTDQIEREMDLLAASIDRLRRVSQ